MYSYLLHKLLDLTKFVICVIFLYARILYVDISVSYFIFSFDC